MHVSIITATTGDPVLADAVAGVLAQTHADLDLTVVVDGPRWHARAAAVLAPFDDPRLNVVNLPYPTGERHNGHRIYGAFTFLVPGDVILFLDEDNWYAPDHVETMVAALTAGRHDWVYCLRTVHERDGTLICRDDCESLGKWASVLHEQDHLVDVNCYALTRRPALHMANLWFREKYTGIDRILYLFLSTHHPNFDCTGRYTLRYRAGAPSDKAVEPHVFLTGNDLMTRLYPDRFPWDAETSRQA